MKVLHALSGELIAEVENGEGRSAEVSAAIAASEALGIPKELLRVIVTECTVVVLSGKVVCSTCDKRIGCSCKAEDDAACQCETLEDKSSWTTCDACVAEQEHQIDLGYRLYEQRKEEEWGRW